MKFKNKDMNKDLRDSMDSTLESKFLSNLQWSMLFFVFNQVCNAINQENEFENKNYTQLEFIKTWKKFVYSNIATQDLKIINDILNSPKNIFYSALQNSNEVSESTEIYQEKYDSIIKKIEKFFLKTLENNYYNDIDDNEDEEE